MKRSGRTYSGWRRKRAWGSDVKMPQQSAMHHMPMPLTARSSSFRALLAAAAFALMALILTACEAAATAVPAPTYTQAPPSETATSRPEPTHTASPAPPTATAIPQPDDAWGQGPLDAAVHMVVYSDFQ